MVNNIRTKSWKKKTVKSKKTEDAPAVIREYKEIIKSKKRSIIWLAYQHRKVFQKFKENMKFIEMVKQFGVTKSTTIFKINIVKLIDKHPKIKNSSLSLHLLKNYLKMVKKICEKILVALNR